MNFIQRIRINYYLSFALAAVFGLLFLDTLRRKEEGIPLWMLALLFGFECLEGMRKLRERKYILALPSGHGKKAIAERDRGIQTILAMRAKNKKWYSLLYVLCALGGIAEYFYRPGGMQLVPKYIVWIVLGGLLLFGIGGLLRKSGTIIPTDKKDL